MKKYNTPEITIIEVKQTSFLCSSYLDDRQRKCNCFCKHWHFCQDRCEGKKCYDKVY